MQPTYVTETFTNEEADVLRRYFTNLDSPVFALANLPEVVKGALFARYSRTHKSLRRLFLDEFVNDLDIEGDTALDAREGVGRSVALYASVFEDFGDESVAQLGGVHLACEQASILLTKVLEWGRLMSYLEQSTRYLNYDHRLVNGRYRYFRAPEIMDSSLATRYVGDMDRMFDAYAEMLALMQEYHLRVLEHAGDIQDHIQLRSLARTRALDSVRGMLPAATISNVGIFGSGQAYANLIERMRAHPLLEVREYAKLILVELRKVIPSFLLRVDDDTTAEASSSYLETNRMVMEEVAAALFPESIALDHEPLIRLVDFDPDGETKVLAAMLFPYTHESESRLCDRVERMTMAERRELLRAYIGTRKSRHNKPGRAFERTSYRFEVCGDFGSFRDLQRHRMATVEFQSLRTTSRFSVPPSVQHAGLEAEYGETLERSALLYRALQPQFPVQAQYAVSLAFPVRYVMQFNAREAMHVLELRSAKSGHAAYRKIAQQMHELISNQAGHSLLAESMLYVDHMDYENV